MMRWVGLRNCRESRLYNEGELGWLVGMRAGEIVSIERGDRLVRPETAVRLARALQVDLHLLTESPRERAAEAYNASGGGIDVFQAVIDCFDPAHRRVIARLGWWQDHIVAEHREVAEHVDAVQRAIEQPDLITRDVIYPNGENYYRMDGLPGYPGKYLKVCVGYESIDRSGDLVAGEIVTAYPTRRVKGAEQQLWPS